jgi:hypothetical protein
MNVNAVSHYLIACPSYRTTQVTGVIEYALWRRLWRTLNMMLRMSTMLSVRNTGEAGEKPLRKRVERVASRLFHNHALACGCLKAEEVFHGGKVRGLHVFGDNQLSYNGFIGSRKALLKSILLHSFVVPAETQSVFFP